MSGYQKHPDRGVNACSTSAALQAGNAGVACGQSRPLQDAAYGAYGHQNFADHSAQPSPKLYDPSTGRLALSTDTSYGPSAGYEAKQTSYPQYNLQNTSILYYTDRQESTLLSPQSVREKPPLPSRSAEASEPTGRRAVSQQLYSRPPYQNTSDSYHTDMPGYSSTSRSIPHSASTSSIPVYETTRQGLRRRFPTVSSSYAPHDSVGPTLNSSYGAFNGPGRNVAVSPEQSPPSPHLLASRKIVTLPLIRHYCLREILGPNTPNHKACLDIRGDLPSMTSNWTPAEWKMKRRVVQFRRAQLGTTITAQFEGVAPEARSPKAGCISCIWWEAKGEYCATSADIIALFGFLVGMRRVDKKEQNRIRRNIETFGAITTGLINTEDMTTSKPRSQSCEDLFQLIMSFEHPKPRQIKKALKVFQWKHLDHMLRKVMDKYCADVRFAPSTCQIAPSPSMVEVESMETPRSCRNAYAPTNQPDYLTSDVHSTRDKYTNSPLSTSDSPSSSAYSTTSWHSNTTSPNMSHGMPAATSVGPQPRSNAISTDSTTPLLGASSYGFKYSSSMQYPYEAAEAMSDGTAQATAGSQPKQISWHYGPYAPSNATANEDAHNQQIMRA